MTRDEHLDWCKKRALEYVEANDFNNAFGSMASDLGKHPDTVNHIGIRLGMTMLMSGMLNDKASMEKFIKDFN